MSSKESVPLPEDLRAAIAAKLELLWRANKPLMLERAAALKTNCEAWLEDPENGKAAATACDAAHKLAGVLGTFSLRRGSEIASQIEAVLTLKRAANDDERAQMHNMVEELALLIATKE